MLEATNWVVETAKTRIVFRGGEYFNRRHSGDRYYFYTEHSRVGLMTMACALATGPGGSDER